MSAPKILVLDIETSPMITYTFGINDQFIGLPQVVQESYIISFSAKWYGSPENEVYYMDQRNVKDLSNNKKLLQEIWKLMDKADIILGQNSKRFDVKRLNTEFELNGLGKPSSFRQLDTLTIAKQNFNLPSYKLEYMSKRFCIKHKKSGHKKFAGIDLWKECLNNNLDAWKEMEKYNIKDVLTTEELYSVFSKWDSSIDFSVYSEDLNKTCNCGSKKFKSKGYRYTNTGKFKRYICKTCNKESQSKINLLTKEKKASLKK